jgi:hypothetical protein
MQKLRFNGSDVEVLKECNSSQRGHVSHYVDIDAADRIRQHNPVSPQTRRSLTAIAR